MFTHRLVFPASVLRGRGAIKHLGSMCGRLGQRALLVGGKRAIASVEASVIDQLEQQMVSYLGHEVLSGECCQEEISRLAERLLLLLSEEKAGMRSGLIQRSMQPTPHPT